MKRQPIKLLEVSMAIIYNSVDSDQADTSGFGKGGSNV
jgi:hypothetical protein